jgi:hypothetical protein
MNPKCNTTKEGNKSSGADCISDGWKLIVGQDDVGGWRPYCPTCAKLIEDLADQITELVPIKYVMLYQLLNKEKEKEQ